MSSWRRRVEQLVVLACVASCGRHRFDPVAGADAAACMVTLAPATTRLNTASERVFTPTGGAAPYRFEATGPAVIDASTGVLTAGDEPGVVTITTTDDAGCSAQATATIGGDTLWLVGGTLPVPATAEVWRSTDGLAWSLAGNLPDRRAWGALVVWRDRLLYLGGYDGTTAFDEVFASADGVTWQMIGRLPVATYAFGFTTHAGELWIAGGRNNADNVYRSPDGVTWTLAGHLPMTNHGGSLVSAAGRLWYAGGHEGSLFDWVIGSDDGAAWAQTATLAIPREYHEALRTPGAMWLLGGQDTTPTPLASVATSPDGITWSPGPDLPVARALGAVTAFGGRVWSFGGSNNAGVYSTDGTTWRTETTTLPPRKASEVAAFTPP